MAEDPPTPLAAPGLAEDPPAPPAPRKLRTLKGQGPGDETQAQWVRVLEPLGGTLLASTCGADVCLWDANDGGCYRTFTAGHGGGSPSQKPNWVGSLACFRRGALLASCSDVAVTVWDLSGDAPPAMVLQGHSGWVNSLCGCEDDVLVSGSDDCTLRAWNVDEGRCLGVLKGHTNSVSAVAPDAASGLVFSGSKDFSVKAWHLSSGTCSATFAGHEGYINGLASLPGRLVASCSDDTTIKLWSMESEGCVRTLEGHGAAVQCLAAVGEGLLASGGKDNSVKLWSVADGRCVATLKGHRSWVRSLAALDGGLLASGSEDRNIHVWSLR